MSTIATVTVNQCEGCSLIAVLHSPDDYASFETNWYDGWRTHFCPDCKVKPENSAAIAEDGEITEQLRGLNDGTVEPPRKEVYGH